MLNRLKKGLITLGIGILFASGVSAKSPATIMDMEAVIRAYEEHNIEIRKAELDHILNKSRQTSTDKQYKKIEGAIAIAEASLRNQQFIKEESLKNVKEDEVHRRKNKDFWEKEFVFYIMQEEYASRGYRQALSSQVSSFVRMELNRNSLKNSQETFNKKLAISKMDFIESLYQYEDEKKNLVLLLKRYDMSKRKLEKARLAKEEGAISFSDWAVSKDGKEKAGYEYERALISLKVNKDKIKQQIGLENKSLQFQITLPKTSPEGILSYKDYQILIKGQNVKVEALELETELLNTLGRKIDYLDEREDNHDKYAGLRLDQQRQKISNDQAIALLSLQSERSYRAFIIALKRLQVAEKVKAISDVEYESEKLKFNKGYISEEALLRSEIKWLESNQQYRQTKIFYKRAEHGIYKSIYGV